MTVLYIYCIILATKGVSTVASYYNSWENIRQSKHKIISTEGILSHLLEEVDFLGHDVVSFSLIIWARKVLHKVDRRVKEVLFFMSFED